MPFEPGEFAEPLGDSDELGVPEEDGWFAPLFDDDAGCEPEPSGAPPGTSRPAGAPAVTGEVPGTTGDAVGAGVGVTVGCAPVSTVGGELGGAKVADGIAESPVLPTFAAVSRSRLSNNFAE